MNSKTDKAFPASSTYPDMEERARDVFGNSLDFIDGLPDLDFIDGLPDGPGKKLEIPFPYGPGVPRPYGWGLFPELHPSRDDDQG